MMLPNFQVYRCGKDVFIGNADVGFGFVLLVKGTDGLGSGFVDVYFEVLVSISTLGWQYILAAASIM